ncbi:MAG: hypothetical protein WDM89_09160 [Rhizomicrobium sp.]
MEFTRPALLSPKFSPARLRDAHYAWRLDIKRVEATEPNLGDGLDHFKQSAHLAYWLRRKSPIVDYHDWAAEIEDLNDLYPDEVERRDLLLRYGEEYLAFDFGLKICTYYELERLDNPRSSVPKLSKEYIFDVCHMLKFKHVSPHAMYLIYKSILL